MEANIPKKLRSLPEGAQDLGISPFTLKAYARRGLITITRIGRRVLISENEIERIARDGIAAGGDKRKLTKMHE